MHDDAAEPNWIELIAQLRLEAGRIMEDASVGLAQRFSSVGRARADQLRDDLEAASDARALLAAAQVLHRRCLRT